MIKSWIVYQTPEGKIDAIEDDHETARMWVFNQGCEIVGYPAFKQKRDAIDYIKFIMAVRKRKPTHLRGKIRRTGTQ
jgi:hypothetical protein